MRILKKRSNLIIFYIAELGTRQHCRDNVTMFSSHKSVGYCFITIFVVAKLYLDTETLIFIEFFLVPEALLRCRCRESLKYCRMFSSVKIGS